MQCGTEIIARLLDTIVAKSCQIPSMDKEFLLQHRDHMELPCPFNDLLLRVWYRMSFPVSSCSHLLSYVS